MATAADKPAETPEKKSLLDKVVTITPVVMAIIATLLAGLSSSEMTKAQYFRSVAGQNQSKAGDQWGFFQAKRIRGNQMENEVDLLPVTSRPGALKPMTLKVATARLAGSLKEAKSQVEALKKAAEEKKVPEVVAAADEFLKDPFLKKVAEISAENLMKLLDADLDKNKDAFQYLGTRKLPPPPLEDAERKEALDDPALKECLKALDDRATDEELAPLIRNLKVATLRTAIHASELHSKKFEDASEPTNQMITALMIALSTPLRVAAQYHQLVLMAETLMPSSEESVKDPVQAAAKVDAKVSKAAENLNALFKSAQHDYTARRYREEAKNNLKTALYYEVQVHRSDASSDSHRNRSAYFFYGMLGAQCGVAIGSIALAARRKGFLWGLATTAGVLAAGLGTYVYLTM